MSEYTAYTIARSLIKMGFNGRIGIVGFGEPLTHKGICEIVQILRIVDAQWIEVNTNGDFLDRKIIEDLYRAGCTHITVSMYDKDISETLFDMAKGIPIVITPRHNYKEKFELQLVNRIEILDPSSVHSPLNKPCYVPFYKMFIDWNGDVLICNNDWGRKGIVGNVNHDDIQDIWLSDNLRQYREFLQAGARDKCTPCNKCNIDGTKFGKESFDLFQEVVV